MSPEEKARQEIDIKLREAGCLIQDRKKMNIRSFFGVAVREFPTSTGEVDYALFIDSTPVGIIEAKREENGEDLTTVEEQSARYADSEFKNVPAGYKIRFVYEATNKLIRFTDYKDIKFRSRKVYSFHRYEVLVA